MHAINGSESESIMKSTPSRKHVFYSQSLLYKKQPAAGASSQALLSNSHKSPRTGWYQGW